jgi:hypothetical protein
MTEKWLGGNNFSPLHLRLAECGVCSFWVFVLLGWNRAAFWVAARFTLYGYRACKS